tara:strand:- start:193 stop:372 length:180 start_codon:yes stop_codon:yes gene_type:complete
MEIKMAEAKKEVKKEVKKAVKKATKFKISKPNGNVIYRDSLDEAQIKMYKSKKCSVEEA